MAEAVLSPLVELLLQNLTSQATNVIQLVKGGDKEIEKLRRTLGRIQALLTDAERREVTEETVRLWINDLRDVAYDTEDILDKFATKSLLLHSYKDDDDHVEEDARHSSPQEQQVCCYFSSPCRNSKQAKLRYSTAKKIKEIRVRLDEILNEGSALKLCDLGTKSIDKKKKAEDWRQTDSFVDESETYGRDEDKRKIIQMILGSENSSTLVNHHHPHVVAVVGLGGLGKTTLAKLVYNDASVVNHFELRMWVCVSDDFGVKRLIRMIIESIIEVAPSNDLGMQTLQSQLRDKINGRRYLLVLDDVWDDDQDRWDTMHSALKCGAEGSSIIVTTRSDNVAKVRRACSHRLVGLSDDYCWALFKKRAFENEIEQATYPNLEPIGREIVKKCGGVPLAAKALGSLMFNKRVVNEWQYVRDSEIWTLSDESQNGILPALKLSYNHLPPHLKQCFVYCSIFPKDSRLEKKRLIQLWAAQGFIQSSSMMRSLHDIGNEYFNELLWRSFFQDVEKDEYGDIEYCKMHDLNHDLAQSIAGDECFALGFLMEAAIPKQVRHLSYYDGDNVRTPVSKIRVRTLISIESYILHHAAPIDVISSLKGLRALTLWNGGLRELPSSICTLIHLRYLEINDDMVEKLPQNITNLRNLQTLKLANSRHLKELPQGMSYFKKLMHLEIDDGLERKLRKMPANIGQLKFLQTLPVFIVGKEIGCGMDELSCLKCLHGSIKIRNLENVPNVDKAKEAKLGEKPHLHALELSWSEVETSGSEARVKYSRDVQVEVLEGLQPHPRLQRLRIDNYAGVQIPKWLANLSYLKSLVLFKCDALTSLLSLKMDGLTCLDNIKMDLTALPDDLPRLPNLKKLDIRGCDALTSLFSVTTIRGCFPSLQELVVRGCKELTCLWAANLPKARGLSSEQEKIDVELQSLPNIKRIDGLTCLENIEILRCRNLIALPDDLPHLPNLKYLCINTCDALTSLFSVTTIRDCFPSLQKLRISNCKELTCLWAANLPKAHGLSSKQEKEEDIELQSLPNLKGINGLTCLENIEIFRCRNLTTLPDDLPHLPNLKKLEIQWCDALTSLFSVTTVRGCFHSLEELGVADCKELTCLWATNLPKARGLSSEQEKEEDVELQSLPNLKGMDVLTCLQNIYISRCRNLTALPDDLPHLPNLKRLEISYCHALTSLFSVTTVRGCFPSLQVFMVFNCKELTCLWARNLPRHVPSLRNKKYVELQSLRNFKWLLIKECDKLSELPEWLGNCQQLNRVDICDCDSLRSLPDSLNAPPLKYLYIERCKELRSLPDSLKKPPLKVLEIEDCPMLEEWATAAHTD